MNKETNTAMSMGELFTKYAASKNFIENMAKNSPLLSYVIFGRYLCPPGKIIPGALEKSSADSYHYQADIKITFKNGKLAASIGPYWVENLDSDFPFKNGKRFLIKIIDELENVKMALA